MNFVEKIHAYFCSSQRVARLKAIQESEGMLILGLKNYKEIRWLSLGESLKRILEIWPSLILYMNKEILVCKADEKKRIEKFKDNLNQKVFKVKIHILSKIIGIINQTNAIFQTPTLEVQRVKSQTKQIIQSLAQILFNEVHSDLLKVKAISDWESDETKEKFEHDYSNFMKKIEIATGAKLGDNCLLSTNEKNEILKIFQNFLASMVRLLLDYLPLDDAIVGCLDFVSLYDFKDKINLLKEKVMFFNQKFNIVSEQDFEAAILEIDNLQECSLEFEKTVAKKSSLDFWSLIEHNFGSNVYHLSQIWRAAHSLPTSSSNMEQSFSKMKLIKSLLRSSLQEDTVQSLLLIAQEYQDVDEIEIPQKLIEAYHRVRYTLNKRKSGEGTISNNLQSMQDREEEKESDPDFTFSVKEDSETKSLDDYYSKKKVKTLKDSLNPSKVINENHIEVEQVKIGDESPDYMEIEYKK